jgi:aminoglycoside 6'-N-acetyltransferase
VATTPTVRLRRMTRADLPALARWLAEPVVARWWSEHPPKSCSQDFGAELDPGDGVDPGATDYLVVEADGRDVGMLQRYPIAAYDEYVDELSAAGIEVPAGAWSIDYLIGEPSARGRGLGAAMMAAAVEGIWADAPAATCVIVPVNVENGTSWGALLRAGFARLPDAEMEPDNPGDPRTHVVCRLDRPGLVGDGPRA